MLIPPVIFSPTCRFSLLCRTWRVNWCDVSLEQDLLPHYMIIMINQVDIILEPKFPELFNFELMDTSRGGGRPVSNGVAWRSHPWKDSDEARIRTRAETPTLTSSIVQEPRLSTEPN